MVSTDKMALMDPMDFLRTKLLLIMDLSVMNLLGWLRLCDHKESRDHKEFKVNLGKMESVLHKV